MYEFDVGYAAWEIPPERKDLTRPPDVVGGSCIVIDKETGAVTTWPLLDREAIAENYRRRLRGEPVTWDP